MLVLSIYLLLRASIYIRLDLSNLDHRSDISITQEQAIRTLLIRIRDLICRDRRQPQLEAEM
jgi:hypothetical protein